MGRFLNKPLYLYNPPIKKSMTSLQLYTPKMKTLNSISSIYASNVNFPLHISATNFLYPFPQIRFPSIFYSQNQNFNYPIKSNSSIPKPSSPPLMASSTTPSSAETKPFSVLFVCLGNICRSPAAEGVFRDLVKKRGLDSEFFIDSAGTIDYHEGNPADSRMRSTAKRRGIEITSISRPIRSSDFTEFDLILAMDNSNKADILEAYGSWKKRGNLPPDADKKVKLMCSNCKRHEEKEVPDPYYGGQQGFEKVLDILDDACESLLDSILSETSQT